MLQELTPQSNTASYVQKHALAALDQLQHVLKSDPEAFTVLYDKRIPFLDSLCDQIVTATGVGTFLGMDVPGAADETDQSNWSKFVDGKPLRNPETSKIMKGPDYFKPDLKKFVNP